MALIWLGVFLVAVPIASSYRNLNVTSKNSALDLSESSLIVGLVSTIVTLFLYGAHKNEVIKP